MGDVSTVSSVQIPPAPSLQNLRHSDVANLISKVFNTVLEMRKDGYAESTLKTTLERLKRMAKHVDLDNPEAVREYIANKNCSVGFKEGLVCCYDRYVKKNGLTWNKPKYERDDPVIKLPTIERLDRIIASCKLKHALGFTLLKETGIRPVELFKLSLKDLDLESGIVYIRTAKHGKSRSIKLKSKTLAMLTTYISKNSGELLFSDPKDMSKAFQRARNRVASKFHDPETKKIRLYDLRHFFGSMLYHNTKDILYVKDQMGHRSISSTMKYMHLVNFETDEWVSRVAKTVEESCSLVEAGFEYVTEMDGVKIFRKRK